MSAAPAAPPAPAARAALWPRVAVARPRAACAAALLVPLLALALIAATRQFRLQSPTGADYFVRDDLRTRLDDARAAARARFAFRRAAPAAARSATDAPRALDLLLRAARDAAPVPPPAPDEPASPDRNVLTPAGLARLKRAEDAVLRHPRFPAFCLRDPDARDCAGAVPVCALPESILNSPLLYGETRPGPDGDPVVCARSNSTAPVSDAAFRAFLVSLVDGSAAIKPAASVFLGVDAAPDSLSTWVIRSRFRVGRPFDGFSSVDDRAPQQEDLYDDWAADLKPAVDALSTPRIHVFLTGFQLANAVFGDIAIRDLSFSIAAIVLVFLVIWLHTSSAFLALTAMLQIFLAFPLAYVFYRFVFQQRYFAALQILAIFLLLGIGADDVFVFTDAWRQAPVVLGPHATLLIRMDWTYRRAVKAMSVTSVTTAAAFFVTAASPIMPIATLGVWAGLLILFQFALVITVYPCAVVIWERFWRTRLFVRCFQRPSDDEAEYELNLPFYQRFLPKKWRPQPNTGAAAEYRPIERFFRGPWLRMVNKLRYPLLVVAAALVATSIYLATRLEPPRETENFLPPSHPIAVATKTLRDAFPASRANVQLRVRVTWGISDVDRTGTSKFEPDDQGEAILDKRFDLKSADAQEHLLRACSYFNRTDLIFQGGTIENPIDCWIQDYLDWRKTRRGKNGFETFTSDQALAEDLIAFGEFEEDGKKPYRRYLNDEHVAFSSDRKQVVFAEVRFVSSTRAAVPYSVMWPIYSEWQDLLTAFNDAAPEGVDAAIATGGFSWKWQISQRSLVRSMFQGIGIMLAVALVTLTLSTLNWAVAILATLSIGGIVAMLLGIISLLGWELGITESVGVVIAIGYSFDGTAHIATAYVESESERRYEKTRDALTDLGISILFGAITTLLAGFMLFPAIITFFVKFAGLIVATVSLSLVWSLIFFPALLLVVGPTAQFGSLAPLFSRAFAWIKCFKREERLATADPSGVEKDMNAAGQAENMDTSESNSA